MLAKRANRMLNCWRKWGNNKIISYLILYTLSLLVALPLDYPAFQTGKSSPMTTPHPKFCSSNWLKKLIMNLKRKGGILNSHWASIKDLTLTPGMKSINKWRWPSFSLLPWYDTILPCLIFCKILISFCRAFTSWKNNQITVSTLCLPRFTQRRNLVIITINTILKYVGNLLDYHFSITKNVRSGARLYITSRAVATSVDHFQCIAVSFLFYQPVI